MNQYINWKWITIGLLLALNLIMPLRSRHDVSSAAEDRRFVYVVVEVPAGDTVNLQSTLNNYGNDGWELVSVMFGDIQVPKLVFKK
ncbi:MAG: hypothetical protein ACT4OO_03820 [Nitrospiraceae bacterium]